jgi:hypothetical protein
MIERNEFLNFVGDKCFSTTEHFKNYKGEDTIRISFTFPKKDFTKNFWSSSWFAVRGLFVFLFKK